MTSGGDTSTGGAAFDPAAGSAPAGAPPPDDFVADADRARIDASRAPLLDHLIELRRRMLWSLAALVVAFFVCYHFAEQIFGFLVQPLKNAGQSELIYTQLFEAFFVQVKVALFAAFMCAFPVIATQVWRFVAPGLYRNEKRAILPFLFATPVLFTMGAALAYYGVIPVALKFLLSFQGNVGGVQQDAMPAVGNYLDFVMHFTLAFGIAFLLPILLMLLERAGIVTLSQLKGIRRYAIVVAFAVAAVVTPPDPISMLMLAIPLCMLFEISLFAIRLTGGKAAEAEAGAT